MKYLFLLLTCFACYSIYAQRVAFSPDGKCVLLGSGNVKLWNITSGEEIQIFRSTDYFQHNWIKTVAFSPNGKYILSGSQEDYSIELLNVGNGKLEKYFTGHKGTINSVAFSPNGKYILSGSDDNTLKLWEVATGKEIQTFKGHNKSVFSVVFSSDGKYALSASGDFSVKLWDIVTGKEIRTIKGHSYWVLSVVFSPDGKYILSGSYDKTMKLWEVATGKEIRTFTGHTEGVSSVAFSPDGKYILSGSYDNTLKIWEVVNGKIKYTFTRHNDWIRSATFSSDGKYILSSSCDHIMKLWEFGTGKEIRTFFSGINRIDTHEYIENRITANEQTRGMSNKEKVVRIEEKSFIQQKNISNTSHEKKSTPIQNNPNTYSTDRTSPIINIENLKDTFFTKENKVFLKATITDNIAVKKVQLNNEELLLVTNRIEKNVALITGENLLTLTATDEAGNTTKKEIKVISYFTDKEKPKIELVSPTQKAQTVDKPTYRLQFKASDNIEVKFVSVDSILLKQKNGIYETILSLKDGENTFNIKATDKNFNEITQSIQITYKPRYQVIDRKGKDKAVFFAVNNYESTFYPYLSTPIKESEQIAQILNQKYGFDTLIFRNPTRQQVLEYLRTLQNNYTFNRYNPKGQLLLYFSGHGDIKDDIGYFCTTDAGENLFATAIQYYALKNQINNFNCKHILVCIDACYSGTFDEKLKVVNRSRGTEGDRRPDEESTERQVFVEKNEKIKTRLVYTSDSKAERTPKDSQFASKFIEGLKDNRNRNGILDAETLFFNFIRNASPTPYRTRFGSSEDNCNFLFIEVLK